MDENETTSLLPPNGQHKHSNGTIFESNHMMESNVDVSDTKRESFHSRSYTWDKMLLDDIDFDDPSEKPPSKFKLALAKCSCNCKLSKKTKHNLQILKITVMFLSMFVCALFVTLKDEVVPKPEIFPISSQLSYLSNISIVDDRDRIKVRWRGPVYDTTPVDIYFLENVTLSLVTVDPDGVVSEPLVEPQVFGVKRDFPIAESDTWPDLLTIFTIPSYPEDHQLALLYQSNTDDLLSISSDFNLLPPSARQEVVCAAVILVGVYVLIGFELVHRTTAAMLGAFATLAVLTSFNERPTLEAVMEWLDYDTLALLWGMMTIVAIFSETGFFDYCALLSYKWAKGKIWTLVTILCFFSGIVSAFLDNVTTILLLTPVTISLCEVLDIDPRKVLIAEVIFSNIGGTATAIGDPPNVIIVSNSEIQDAGINFTEFTIHMAIGIVFCMIIGYFMLRLLYRNVNLHSKEPPEIRNLKHEIEIWRQAATRIMVASKEESTVKALLMQKVYQLETELRNQLYVHEHTKGPALDWKDKLAQLETRYRITDKVLLAKCSFVLAVTILLFFIHSVETIYLDLGWIAIMGAVGLLLLADVHDIENVMHRVEWATLLFFAALFVLMEGLTELGLIKFIGDVVADLISDVPEHARLTVAIILILWVSALASSFIDNIPFTTAMIPIILDLAERPELGLPLKPMVWSLAFGACLGGNGTLIGASANVVCAGIADQHGYGFSFVDFFKVGFPMMLCTTFVAMIYLLICHSWLEWNY